MATSKKIVLEFDIDTSDVKIAGQDTLSLVQQLKILKRELQKGDLKAEQFDILRKKIGDTEDRIAKTNTKAKDFFGVLSTLPGPVGAFASSLQQGIELLKVFSSFTFKDIKNSLSDVADDIEDVGKNLSGLGGGETTVAISSATTNTSELANSVENLGDKLTKTIQPLNDISKANRSVGDSVSEASSKMNVAAISATNYATVITANAQAYKMFGAEKANTIAKLDILEEKFGANFRMLSNGNITVQELDGSYRMLTKSEMAAVKSTSALTMTTAGLVTAEKQATFWTTTLGATIKGVLIGTGIGIAIVLIGTLVEMLYKYASALMGVQESTEETAAEVAKLNALLEMQKHLLDNDMQAIDSSIKIMVTRAKIAGKTEEEINKIYKEAGKERLELLRTYDKQLYDDQQRATKNTKITSEERLKLLEDINAKIVANGQAITKQILDNESQQLDGQLAIIEKNKEKAKKSREDANNNRLRELDALIKLEIDKEKTSGKILEAYLIEKLNIRKKLEKLSAAEIQVIKNENAKIENDALIDDIQRNIQAEIDRYARLADEAGVGTKNQFDQRREVAQQEYLKEIQEAERDEKTKATKIENARVNLWKKLIEIDKAGLDAQIAIAQLNSNAEFEGTTNFFNGQRDLENANYERQQAEARGNFDKLEALKRDHNKKLVMIDAAELKYRSDLYAKQSQTEQENYIEVEDNFVKSFKIIKELNQRKYDDMRAQADYAYEADITAAGDNAALKEEIERQHAATINDIMAQQVEANAQTTLMIEQTAINFGQALSTLGDQLMSQFQKRNETMFKIAKGIAIAGIVIEKAAAIGQIWTNNAIANAKAIAAFPLTAGQPWVTINTIQAGISTAATVFAATQAISQINGTTFSGGAGGSGGNQLGRNYADGGMIGGNRHADGGTMIEAEKGEAIMTRGSVAMFGPLLSMLNQAGGGTSFSQGAIGASTFDSPRTSNPSQDSNQMIVKTYVVANEMQSEAHKQNRLKDLSTL
jgi:hypothetical protein